MGVERETTKLIERTYKWGERREIRKMRDTHGKKYDAQSFEMGFDVSENDDYEAYTYASSEEENNFGTSIWNEVEFEKDME